MPHLCGFSPVCISTCVFKFPCKAKDFPQTVHIYCFCPLWLSKCVFRLLSCTNILLHIPHVYDFSFIVTVSGDWGTNIVLHRIGEKLYPSDERTWKFGNLDGPGEENASDWLEDETSFTLWKNNVHILHSHPMLNIKLLRKERLMYNSSYESLGAVVYATCCNIKQLWHRVCFIFSGNK